MCKHVVLIPVKPVDSAMQKKICRPAMFGRVWLASRRALSFELSPPHQFACAQWQNGQRPSLAYLVYRWILFVTVVSISILSFVLQGLPPHYHGPLKKVAPWKWFIYLTNWGLMLIILQSALAVAVVHRYRAKRNLNIPYEDSDNPSGRRLPTPLLCRLYWLSHVVATDLALVITIVYWTCVYSPENATINAVNILVHGCNTVIMLMELAMTSHPIRCAHALHAAAAGLVYGAFSAVYWAAGGTDRIEYHALYPALDWTKPGKAIGFVAMCACVMMFAHACVTLLATLRRRLAVRCYPAGQLADILSLPAH